MSSISKQRSAPPPSRDPFFQELDRLRVGAGAGVTPTHLRTPLAAAELRAEAESAGAAADPELALALTSLRPSQERSSTAVGARPTARRGRGASEGMQKVRAVAS